MRKAEGWSAKSPFVIIFRVFGGKWRFSSFLFEIRMNDARWIKILIFLKEFFIFLPGLIKKLIKPLTIFLAVEK